MPYLGLIPFGDIRGTIKCVYIAGTPAWYISQFVFVPRVYCSTYTSHSATSKRTFHACVIVLLAVVIE